MDLLIKRLFGKSSEKVDEAQLMLLLQGDEEAERKKDQASSADPGALQAEIARRDKEGKARAPRQEREARVPEHLPAVDEVIEPEEVKADPQAWLVASAMPQTRQITIPTLPLFPTRLRA